MIITENLKYNNINFQYCYDTLDTSGEGCINEIVKRDEYQLYKYFNKNGVFIDIGGNHGICSIILSKQNPKGKIFILEPDPILVERIKHNIEINNCKNITIISKGLGSGENVTLHHGHGYSGGNCTVVNNISMFKAKQNGLDKSEIVETITFDNLLSTFNISNIELLKIDCEGGEYYLYDSEKFRSSIVKNLVGEFHNLSYNKNNLKWNYTDLTKYVKKYVKGDIKLTYLDL